MDGRAVVLVVLAVEVCGGLGSIAWRELEVLATPGSEASGAQLLSCRVTGELTPQVPSMALTPPRIEGVRA